LRKAIWVANQFCRLGRAWTRQYGWLLDEWIAEIGLAQSADGALIYRKTGNIRAVQLLLGHRKLDSTVRYLGVEVEDALAIAEATMFDNAITRNLVGAMKPRCCRAESGRQ
jgi:hypothetical protein